MTRLKVYGRIEESVNIYSHALGILIGIISIALLISKSLHTCQEMIYTISVGVFGISLVILYTASTLYHSSKDPIKRMKLNVFDHASIFILIAGTYTPFALITLAGKTGWIIFIVVWSIAILGIVLKIFFTGRFRLLSTALYIGMGWIVVIVINPLMNNLETEGLWWIFGGGLSYTLGAIIYSIGKIKYNHAIFHLFVLGGSICHIVCVYQYVLNC